VYKWLKNLEEGVEVEVREENQVTRDQNKNGNRGGGLVYKKNEHVFQDLKQS